MLPVVIQGDGQDVRRDSIKVNGQDAHPVFSVTGPGRPIIPILADDRIRLEVPGNQDAKVEGCLRVTGRIFR